MKEILVIIPMLLILNQAWDHKAKQLQASEQTTIETQTVAQTTEPRQLTDLEVLRKAINSECGICTYEEMLYVGSVFLNRVGYTNRYGKQEWGSTLWSVTTNKDQIHGFATKGWYESDWFGWTADRAAQKLLEDGPVRDDILFFLKFSAKSETKFERWALEQKKYKPKGFHHTILITPNY